MANLCEKTLSACIAAQCENPLFAGVDSEALIFNFSQIASVTYSTTNGNIATGITMGTDGQSNSYCGYTCQQLGNRPYEGSQTEMVEGTYGNKFTHTIQLAVTDNGPDVAHDIIDNFANGKFAVILKNDYVHANGDNKYQMYGFKKGLKCTAITREVWGDNESAWIVTLTEENAPQSATFLFATDATTTDAAYEALKCTCA
ncbi:MAG: hypothetical protein IKH15_08125 [Bacteroidales bacterium]|nr:hypothetical protein [Bacteroidales bacterium]MBR4637052.1 hypothetical protein [Bacteroidales bacterium]